MYAEIGNLEPHDNFELNIERLKKKEFDISHIPWFESFLPRSYREPKMPEKISNHRNKSILACFLHIAASIAGFSFYFIRRSKLYLIINTISLLLSLLGTYGVICMKKWAIIIHGGASSAILGSFFVYSVLESIFNENLNDNTKRGVDDKNITETHVILLLAIPYLVDFLSGLTTYYLGYLVFNYEKSVYPEIKDKEFLQIDLPPNSNIPENICIICQTDRKNAVFYNCGHKIACLNCAKALIKKYRPNCPLCRAKIIDIIQEFE